MLSNLPKVRQLLRYGVRVGSHLVSLYSLSSLPRLPKCFVEFVLNFLAYIFLFMGI